MFYPYVSIQKKFQLLMPVWFKIMAYGNWFFFTTLKLFWKEKTQPIFWKEKKAQPISSKNLELDYMIIIFHIFFNQILL